MSLSIPIANQCPGLVISKRFTDMVNREVFLCPITPIFEARGWWLQPRGVGVYNQGGWCIRPVTYIYRSADFHEFTKSPISPAVLKELAA